MPTQLILALDVPSRDVARPLLRQLSGSLPWVKVGLQMFTAYGPDWVKEVADQGFNVFLDLKLHDIPNTVAKSVESLSALPIGMLTLHTAGGRVMMAAAREAQLATKPHLQLLGVTVLTSMDATGLGEIGCGEDAAAQVSRLAHLGSASGLTGFVCSPLEVGMLSQSLPAGTQLVTPGVRPVGADVGDQSRIMTPGDAARAGSTHIVVGRPILKAPDPAAAAHAIMAELEAAG
ncbi:orotidine-5'-phosphate decarboxylase [Synoicihabitans lomoniglobus]|uniref:Orotidine 5'-phosphate decarboxylase n=1 Tax=Synoicihabitans lomoniglobus TaxID=2909285 RepID=A0AAF0CSY1_9BACT|nr:orotidine-5'-phosphate decarboxylase [Opitutaceae bacterium LMO-M01]WED67475.1 orotidine-5'-phosphate decarboxylase [Opitutaceae bacterium LMO-M01]